MVDRLEEGGDVEERLRVCQDGVGRRVVRNAWADGGRRRNCSWNFALKRWYRSVLAMSPATSLPLAWAAFSPSLANAAPAMKVPQAFVFSFSPVVVGGGG